MRARRLHLSWRPVWLLVAALLLAAACDDGDPDEPEVDPVAGGEVEVAVEVEPASLNVYSIEGFGPVTAQIVGPVLSSLQRVTPDFEYEPVLLEDAPEVLSEVPLRVRYRLRDDAVWDDGSEIVADDVQFTLSQILDPGHAAVNTAGYDKILEGELRDVSEDGKEFTLEFSEPYGAWQDLFSSAAAPILQRSKTEATDFTVALLGDIPFSSGPFRFEQWVRGDHITLVRNDAYWGDPPFLDRITFKFVESPDLMAQALRTGEVQTAHQRRVPRVAADVVGIRGVVVDRTPSLASTQVVMNTTDPVLSNEVRGALALLVDREALVEDVLDDVDPDAAPQGNLFYLADHPAYTENWDAGADPSGAAELLEAAGYSRAGEGGAWERDGQPLQVAMLVTQGNSLHEATAEWLRHELEESGVTLAVEAVPSRTISERLEACEYQMALVDRQGTADPIGVASMYRADQSVCGPEPAAEGRNVSGLQDDEVTQALNEAVVTIDPEDRADLYNGADERLVALVPTLPLYSAPMVLAYYTALQEATDNPTIAGFTWDAGGWWLRRDSD